MKSEYFHHSQGVRAPGKTCQMAFKKAFGQYAFRGRNIHNQLSHHRSFCNIIASDHTFPTMWTKLDFWSQLCELVNFWTKHARSKHETQPNTKKCVVHMQKNAKMFQTFFDKIFLIKNECVIILNFRKLLLNAVCIVIVNIWNNWMPQTWNSAKTCVVNM